jgi:hypothetical protein
MWEIVFHHATHTHPFIQPFSGQFDGSFEVPTTGETAADVFYRIRLTVTDEFGFSDSTTRDVTPNTSMITLDTNPPGLHLQLDDQPTATPLVFESVVGISRTLGVTSPQQFDGTWYRFTAWSDMGTARHEIVTPDGDTAYMGDDIVDLGVLARAGLSAAPVDAVEEVRARADWTSRARAGRGAARELIELILRAQDRWNDIVSFYSGSSPAAAGDR